MSYPQHCSSSITNQHFQPILYQNGRKFHSLLVKKHDDPSRICLYGSGDYQDDDFVIACDYMYPNTTLKKSIFTSFRSYIYYFHFYNRLPIENRVCYEVIPQGKQKPHFDADIEFKDGDINQGKYTLEELGSLMKLALPSAILDVMTEYNVNYNPDLHMIFTDSSTNLKQSFHVVVNGFYHSNNKEALAFYKLVKAKLPPSIRDYLDSAVYKANQQFRLIGNHKIGKTNVKVLDETITKWRPTDGKPGDEVYNLRILEASMVSFTADSIALPSFISDENTITNKKFTVSDEDCSIYEDQIISIYNSSSVSASGKIRDFNGPIANITSSHRFRCPICNKVHDHENPQLILSKGSLYWDCRRRTNGARSLFIGRVEGYTNPDHFDPDDYVEDNTNINNDDGELLFGMPTSSMDKNKSLLDNFLIHQQSTSISEVGTNKLDENSSLMPQRVQAIPIIGGVIPIDTPTFYVHNGLTSEWTPHMSLMAIENINRTNCILNVHSEVNEGQTLPPCSVTTVATYLDGNIKYVGGNEYNVEEMLDSYERYRNGNGKHYPFQGANNFGRALIELGHFIDRKRIKGNRTQVVTLKRSTPITNVNPIEAVKAVQQSIINTPIMSDETPTASPKEVHRDLRSLNPHEDIPDFRDIYLTRDVEAETDLDNLHLSFVEYCETNKIRLVKFGKGRLISYFKRWLISQDEVDNSIDEFVLKGWKIKEDKEEMNNVEKEKRWRKIWHWNTTPYHIGWHNGKDNERMDKRGTPQWKRIDVHHYNDQNIRNIPQLIELTNSFEKSLPNRVKDIRLRMLVLQYGLLPTEEISTAIKESDNLKVLCSNSLVSGIFTDGSPEHELFKTRIDELNTRITEMRIEAARVMNEEVARLEESIKDDIERIKREASWCIAIRSTFGSGKTVNLKPYIEAFPDMKVLIVLPRKTLTDEFMREYRALGFEIYTETPKGKITGDRIIVCYPSLTRVRGQFDLFVCDEYKSCKDLQHTLVAKTKIRNKLTGKYKSKERACHNAIKHFIANTQRVYIADALLTNAHVLEIAGMRKESDDFSRRVTVYQNMYQKHRGKRVFTVNNQDLMAHKIMESLREGKRVTLADNSKVFAEFVNKKISDSDLNITTSLITADHKATDTLDVLWRDTRFISYSPTILSGNSYTEAVDVIFGYFTTSSCDQADALQMLMRCRNVTSNEYYICVEQGPRRTPIPDHIPLSHNTIKEYLLDLSRSSKLKNVMAGWPEEFRLPIELAEIDYINDGIRDDDPYFISYVNYVKQCVVAERAYLFTMLLYMRDCGFEYGGNIYTKTQDKVAVTIIKDEKKKFKKDRVQDNYEGKSTCKDLTPKEYIEVSNKPVKTKDEKNQCYKYRIKRKYKVNNTPVWFLRAITGGKNKQHSNITKYLSVNGVVDQKQRYELMKKIRETALPTGRTTSEENTLTSNILRGVKTYDAVEDIEDTWTSQDLRLCEHSLNILKIIGADTFIRDIPRFDVEYGEFGMLQYKDYIIQNETDLRTLINDFKIKTDNLASKVTNKAFGIKITATPTGYTINNMWVLNRHNLVWPYNRDMTDREELVVLLLEPTLESKVNIWLKEKLIQVPAQPKVPSVIAKRVPATAIQPKGLFLKGNH